MTSKDQRKDFLLLREWLSGGVANAIASAALNPVDVTKTRLQAIVSSSGSKPRVFTVISGIYHETGILGLWKPGLSASMTREMLYSGPRAGFYVPVRNKLQSFLGHDENQQSLPLKMAAALTTGTIGALIANPVDVIKIRMMVDTGRYKTLFNGLTRIVNEEGPRALYNGLVPSTLRGAMIAMGELATYDHVKYLLKRYSTLEEGGSLHIVSSMITGLVATTVAAPFDLLKTRAMNSPAYAKEGLIRLVSSIVREEGLLVLYRGWLPSYFRLGPHAIICFPIFEQVRKLLGLDYI